MHRLRSLRIVAPALLFASPACSPAVYASGQSTRVVDAGTRVRVRLERNPLPVVGSIAEVRPDTLIVTRHPQTERRTTVAFSDIAALEVSAGHRRLTVIGVAIGAVTGLALTAAYNGIVQSQCFSDCPGRVSTGIGAAAGGVALGGAFHFIRIERWVPIAVPMARDAERREPRVP